MLFPFTSHYFISFFIVLCFTLDIRSLLAELALVYPPLLLTLLALSILPFSAISADIDGKWHCHDSGCWGPDGTYFTFKADGKTLSGTMSYQQGSEHKIYLSYGGS